MSDLSSQDLDGLDFAERTTKDMFNERLLQAQESNANDEVVDRIVSENLSNKSFYSQLPPF